MFVIDVCSYNASFMNACGRACVRACVRACMHACIMNTNAFTCHWRGIISDHLTDAILRNALMHALMFDWQESNFVAT